MRSVLLGFLGHESNVGAATHCLRVESAVLLAELDALLECACIAAIWNEHFRVLILARWSLHLTRPPDGGGHRVVDDNITRHMQVGRPPLRQTSRHSTSPALVWRWSTHATALPTCMCRVMLSSTTLCPPPSGGLVRCRDHLARMRTRKCLFQIAAMQAHSRSASSSARRTALSTRRQWVAAPTLDSWPRKPRSTDRI